MGVADEEHRIRELAKTAVDVDGNNTGKNYLEKKEFSLTKFRELVRSNHTAHIYDRWKNHWIRQGNGWTERWGPDDDEAIEKLKGIHFGQLNGWRWGRLKHLIDAAGALVEGGKAARAALEPVWGGESGPAARKSLENFNSKGRFAAEESWPTLLEHINSMAHESWEVLKGLIEWGASGGGVEGVYNQFYGNLNSEGDEDHRGSLHKLIDLLNEYHGDSDLPVRASPQQIGEFFAATGIGAIDSVLGDTGEEQTEAAQWLDHFCDRYSTALTGYRQAVMQATQSIEEILGMFSRNVSGLEMDLNQFADIPGAEKSPASKSPGSGDDAGGQQQPPSAKGPIPGTVPSGGPVGGVGPTGGAGQASTGMSPPQLPEPPATGASPIGSADALIDPETAAAVNDDVGTTTHRKGDKDISITEPSSAGEMSVGVDDGTGAAKQYKLDFGNDGSKGEGGREASALGSQAGGAKGEAADGVYRPDKDGKIRIKEGDLEIVAEQPPGSDGVTVFHVDDGNGKPETYYLGEEDDIDDFHRQLDEDKRELLETRDELEARRDDVTKKEWDDFHRAEQEFRERGGVLADEKTAESETAADEKRGASAFGAGDDEDKGSGGVASAFGEGGEAAKGASAFGRSGADGGGAGAGGGTGVSGGGADAPQQPGARSGVAGVPAASAPAGGESAAATAASSGQGGARGGMMGGGMMGGMGGAGAGGQGDDQQRTSAYRIEGGLFEPEIADGPFGVARISGSLDEEQS